MKLSGLHRGCLRGPLLLLLTIAFFASDPQPVSAAKVPELIGSEPIVGDLKALEDRRPRLLDTLNDQLDPYGVHFGLGYTATVMGNPYGGKDQGVSYAGLMAFGVSFDLERWWGWSDTQFHISGSWATGSSLTAEYIHNTINVSDVFSGVAARLYELTLQSKFFDDQLEVRIGKISAGQYFAVNPVGSYFLNLSFDQNPAALAYNDPAFAIDPVALWGLMGSAFFFDDRLNIRAAIYDASNPAQWNEYNSGLNFKFNPANGMLFTGQIDYRLGAKYGSGRKGTNLSVGMFVDTGKRPVMGQETATQEGNTNFWFIGAHDFGQVLQNGDSLTAFLTMTGAPQAQLNLFPFSAAAGFVWRGLFSNRPADALALGGSYYHYTPDLPGQSYELDLELAYTLKLTNWMTIQPDLQGVIRPSGTGKIRNALVVGISTEIVF